MPPAGHYDPDAGSSAATEPNLPKRKLGRGSGERSAAPKPKIAAVRAPGGGRPPYGTQGASLGAWPAPIAQAQRMPRKHPYVSRRSATPSWGVARSKEAKPRAQKLRRGNENGCVKSE